MTRGRRPSSQTLAVLSALAAAPDRWCYGYELAAEVGLASGSLYPILMRLSDRGLLESKWEEHPPHGRPPRHLYRLTAAGAAAASEHADRPRASAEGARRLRPRSAS